MEGGGVVGSEVRHDGGGGGGRGSGGGVGGGGMARVAGSQVYFIEAYPNSGLVDGDFISGYFIENGTYSYNTVQNTRKTVRLMEYVAPAKKR